jgi:hypothetical protein
MCAFGSVFLTTTDHYSQPNSIPGAGVVYYVVSCLKLRQFELLILETSGYVK